jgi:hypothetical protein
MCVVMYLLNPLQKAGYVAFISVAVWCAWQSRVSYLRSFNGRRTIKLRNSSHNKCFQFHVTRLDWVMGRWMIIQVDLSYLFQLWRFEPKLKYNLKSYDVDVYNLDKAVH